VQEGETLVKQLKYTEALQAFSRALEIAPDDKEKARLTQRLQDLSVEYQSYIATLGRSGQIVAYLEEARNAYENERYADAAKAAGSVLALDPVNADALKVKGDAEAAQARLRQQKARSTPGKSQTPQTQAAGVTPNPEAIPSPAEPDRGAASQTARLRISVHAEMSEVSVMIRLKNRSIFSETFRSGSRFRRGSVDVERTIELAAGINDLQVFVTPGGKAAEVVSRSGNFPGGESRTLLIRVTGSGPASVNLD
jgi:tetratricopeptide (TPR) repeat protein